MPGNFSEAHLHYQKGSVIHTSVPRKSNLEDFLIWPNSEFTYSELSLPKDIYWKQPEAILSSAVWGTRHNFGEIIHYPKCLKENDAGKTSFTQAED